jgi:hypothetical protein
MAESTADIQARRSDATLLNDYTYSELTVENRKYADEITALLESYGEMMKISPEERARVDKIIEQAKNGASEQDLLEMAKGLGVGALNLMNDGVKSVSGYDLKAKVFDPTMKEVSFWADLANSPRAYFQGWGWFYNRVTGTSDELIRMLESIDPHTITPANAREIGTAYASVLQAEAEKRQHKDFLSGIIAFDGDSWPFFTAGIYAALDWIASFLPEGVIRQFLSGDGKISSFREHLEANLAATSMVPRIANEFRNAPGNMVGGENGSDLGDLFEKGDMVQSSSGQRVFVQPGNSDKPVPHIENAGKDTYPKALNKGSATPVGESSPFVDYAAFSFSGLAAAAAVPHAISAGHNLAKGITRGALGGSGGWMGLSKEADAAKEAAELAAKAAKHPHSDIKAAGKAAVENVWREAGFWSRWSHKTAGFGLPILNTANAESSKLRFWGRVLNAPAYFTGGVGEVIGMAGRLVFYSAPSAIGDWGTQKVDRFGSWLTDLARSPEEKATAKAYEAAAEKMQKAEAQVTAAKEKVSTLETELSDATKRTQKGTAAERSAATAEKAEAVKDLRTARGELTAVQKSFATTDSELKAARNAYRTVLEKTLGVEGARAVMEKAETGAAAPDVNPKPTAKPASKAVKPSAAMEALKDVKLDHAVKGFIISDAAVLDKSGFASHLASLDAVLKKKQPQAALDWMVKYQSYVDGKKALSPELRSATGALADDISEALAKMTKGDAALKSLAERAAKSMSVSGVIDKTIITEVQNISVKSPIVKAGVMDDSMKAATNVADAIATPKFGVVAGDAAAKVGGVAAETAEKQIARVARVAERRGLRAAGKVAARIGSKIPLIGVLFTGGILAETASAQEQAEGSNRSYVRALYEDWQAGKVSNEEYAALTTAQAAYTASGLLGILGTTAFEGVQSQLEKIDRTKIERYLDQSIINALFDDKVGEELKAKEQQMVIIYAHLPTEVNASMPKEVADLIALKKQMQPLQVAMDNEYEHPSKVNEYANHSDAYRGFMYGEAMAFNPIMGSNNPRVVDDQKIDTLESQLEPLDQRYRQAYTAAMNNPQTASYLGALISGNKQPSPIAGWTQEELDAVVGSFGKPTLPSQPAAGKPMASTLDDAIKMAAGGLGKINTAIGAVVDGTTLASPQFAAIDLGKASGTLGKHAEQVLAGSNIG